MITISTGANTKNVTMVKTGSSIGTQTPISGTTLALIAAAALVLSGTDDKKE